MPNVKLSDETWNKLLGYLRSCPDIYLKQESDCRLFFEALLWIARNGSSWRSLPEHYGKWNTIYQRYARWCERGLWVRLFTHFSADPDLEWLILDSTVIRAHPSAAGALKKKGGKRRKR